MTIESNEEFPMTDSRTVLIGLRAKAQYSTTFPEIKFNQQNSGALDRIALLKRMGELPEGVVPSAKKTYALQKYFSVFFRDYCLNRTIVQAERAVFIADILAMLIACDDDPKKIPVLIQWLEQLTSREHKAYFESKAGKGQLITPLITIKKALEDFAAYNALRVKTIQVLTPCFPLESPSAASSSQPSAGGALVQGVFPAAQVLAHSIEGAQGLGSAISRVSLLLGEEAALSGHRMSTVLSGAQRVPSDPAEDDSFQGCARQLMTNVKNRLDSLLGGVASNDVARAIRVNVLADVFALLECCFVEGVLSLETLIDFVETGLLPFWSKKEKAEATLYRAYLQQLKTLHYATCLPLQFENLAQLLKTELAHIAVVFQSMPSTSDSLLELGLRSVLPDLCREMDENVFVCQRQLQGFKQVLELVMVRLADALHALLMGGLSSSDRADELLGAYGRVQHLRVAIATFYQHQGKAPIRFPENFDHTISNSRLEFLERRFGALFTLAQVELPAFQEGPAAAASASSSELASGDGTRSSASSFIRSGASSPIAGMKHSGLLRPPSAASLSSMTSSAAGQPGGSATAPSTPPVKPGGVAFGTA
jgi:hypothetical protein